MGRAVWGRQSDKCDRGRGQAVKHDELRPGVKSWLSTVQEQD